MKIAELLLAVCVLADFFEPEVSAAWAATE
jgi:hypothetical protein